MPAVPAVPAVQTLILWRRETLAWAGDGARTLDRLPNGWALATDEATLPQRLGAARFAPELKVGRDGAPLVVDVVDDAVFDGEAPSPAGSAWIRRGGSDVRLSSAPLAGEWVYGSVMPVYRVVESPQAAEKGLLRPVDVVLLEV